MINVLKVPAVVLTFLAAQLGAAVWWAAQVETRLMHIVGDSHMSVVNENRRFIQEVIMPSYEINDSWSNPHYEAWLRSGGWKTK